MRRIGASRVRDDVPGLRGRCSTARSRRRWCASTSTKPVCDAIKMSMRPISTARFLDVTKAVSDLAKGGPACAKRRRGEHVPSNPDRHPFGHLLEVPPWCRRHWKPSRSLR